MVLRHRPTEPRLRKTLPWLAAANEPAFNAYQSNHGLRVEKSLKKRSYMASFIGHEPGHAVFVGLYEVAGFETITREEFYSRRENQLLEELGSRGPDPDRDPVWFTLNRTELLSDLKGKLVVEWPGLERSWWRISAQNLIPVHAIHEESVLVPALPDAQSLTLTWQELGALPKSWRQAFAQWRGVYLIYDGEIEKSYVGSAYGAENLLSRWENYSKTGHGGNKLLRSRDPKSFVFSILQRVSPDMDADHVIALESSWKDRLHTRYPRGLNDN